MRLCNLLDEWLYSYHKDNVKQQTYLRYECTINNYILNDKISQYKIKKITARDIQEFLNRKKKQKSRKSKSTLSSSTINIIITVLKSAFSYAIDFDLIKDNPCDKIKRLSNKSQKKIVSFTIQEQLKLERFIKSLNNSEYYGIILSLYTGIRIGELFALEWEDIDFEKGIMKIHKTKYITKKENGDWVYETNVPKTKSSIREIPLPYYILKDLKEMKLLSKNKHIVARKDGRFMSSKLLRERFMELTKKIGVRPLNFHALRHTFATRALESGMDVKTLAEVMGHANASITLNIYAHSMMDHKKKMMDNIPQVLAY